MGSGKLESTLTGVHPYARVEVNDRVQAWGLLGFGAGEMTMRPEGKDPIETDIDMRLGAVGAQGALTDAGETGGLDLVLKGDAFLVQMESARAPNTEATQADASRLRLALEGSRTFALGESAALTPGLEVGLRHDGGDAETGTGVELGGRIAYANAASGLSVEASARTLIAHEDSGYEEWGASGSVRLDTGASGRGSRSRSRRRSAPPRAEWSGCGRFAMRASSRTTARSRPRDGSMRRWATACLCSAPSPARPTRGSGSPRAGGTSGSGGA